MAMTEKQKIFADEYLIDLNGTRAYKVAYPNVKKDTTAATNAGRLLRNAEVKNYIDERLEEMHNERTADAQEVIEYLTSVMRGQQAEKTLIGLGEGVQGITEIDVGAVLGSNQAFIDVMWEDVMKENEDYHDLGLYGRYNSDSVKYAEFDDLHESLTFNRENGIKITILSD